MIDLQIGDKVWCAHIDKGYFPINLTLIDGEITGFMLDLTLVKPLYFDELAFLKELVFKSKNDAIEVIIKHLEAMRDD